MNAVKLTHTLLTPIVSEKTVRMPNVAAFWVRTKATKAEIKAAVEKLFGVSVTQVRTVTKPVRPRRGAALHTKRRQFKKKAYVHLAPGQELDLAFEQ